MKRIPAKCSPENCGDLFPKCGTNSTYSYRGCRCDSCCDAGRAYARRRDQAKGKNTAPVSERRACSEANCGDLFPVCGRANTYGKLKCRCDACCEAKSASARRFRESNKDLISGKKREYRENNREKVLTRKREYYLENREQCLERMAAWSAANPDLVKARARRGWRKYRARKIAATLLPYTPEQLAQRFAYYGNRCYLRLDGCTGAGDQIEHVKPLSKGGAEMLCNLRPACKPCNSRKHNKWPFVA